MKRKTEVVGGPVSCSEVKLATRPPSSLSLSVMRRACGFRDCGFEPRRRRWSVRACLSGPRGQETLPPSLPRPFGWFIFPLPRLSANRKHDPIVYCAHCLNLIRERRAADDDDDPDAIYAVVTHPVACQCQRTTERRAGDVAFSHFSVY